MELLGALVLTDYGDRWGALATEVQRVDAHAILSGDGPRRHWLGRARGYSKTTDVAALLIVLLLTLPFGSECAAAAADADQASILVRRMRGLLRRTKVLSDEFEVTARRVTSKRSGSFVEVLAADGASAWGLLPSVVVLDEFPMWRDTQNARELFDALVTALPKIIGSRLIIMGTAGDPAGWAAKVREQALADPDNWRVSEPQGPPPWISGPTSTLNDGTGCLRSSAPPLLEPLDRIRGPAHPARRPARRCHPQRPTGAAPGRRYCLGLDLGITHDRSVAAVCHREADVVLLDRMEVWAGTRTRPVELRLVEEWVGTAARATTPSSGVRPLGHRHATAVRRRRPAGARVRLHPAVGKPPGRDPAHDDPRTPPRRARRRGPCRRAGERPAPRDSTGRLQTRPRPG